MSGTIVLPTALRWQLVGPALPSLGRALVLGESLRAAAMHAATRLGLPGLPDAFHAHAPDGGHDHAHWLPEDRDGDGLVDHMLVYARSGMPPALLSALCTTERVFIDRVSEWNLVPVWMGRPADDGLFAPARAWRAMTAYVTPRWRRPRADEDPQAMQPLGQLQWELRQRGLPAVTRLVWRSASAGASSRLAAHAVQTATRTRRPPPNAAVGFPEIEFATPVPGPLALGFGAHFGLGLFVPMDVERREESLHDR